MQYKPSSSSIQRWHVFTFQTSKSVFTCPNQFACNPWTETPFLLWFWLHLVLYWFLTLWSLVSLSACTSSSRHKERHFCSGEREKKKYCQCIHLCQHHQDNFLLCVHHKLNNLLHRTAGDKTVMFDNIMPMCADKLQMTTLDINCLNSHLNMWEVAVLELQKDLQSTFLVEFFQSLNRSIV